MVSGLDRSVRLKAIEYGARNINLYRFVATDGQPLQPADPGAHIDIEISYNLRRSYSLVNSSEHPDEYVIGVLANERGRGGSLIWHRDSVVGNVYRISPPRNNFPLPDVAEAHLFAGGIGITPIINMYRHLKQGQKRALLYYWVRSLDDALFGDELAVDPDVTVFVTGEDGTSRPGISQVVQAAPPSAHLFCCGPSGMLDEYDTAAACRPSNMVHRERFSGTEQLAHERAFTVHLAGKGIAVDVGPGQTILEACLGAGIDLPYSCEEGICGACEVRVISGAVLHRDSFRPAGEHDRLKTMMVCCSLAEGGELTLDV